MATSEGREDAQRARKRDEDEDDREEDEDDGEGEPEIVDSGDEEEEAAANEETLAADQLAERKAIDEEADGEGNNNDDDGEEYDDGEEEGFNANGEDDGDANGEDDGGAGEEEGEGAECVQEPEKPVKKKSEPYEVPKSGHFYLHDDRTEVKDRGEGEDEEKDNRPRKKLWSDEPKWKHDKYVEDDDDNTREEGSRRSNARRGRSSGRPGVAREDEAEQPQRIEQKPSTHARAARDGRGGGRGGRGAGAGGGRFNEREEADPEPPPAPATNGRGAMRGGRGRGGQTVVVAMGGQLSAPVNEYDRAAPNLGRGAGRSSYQATDRGGMGVTRGGGHNVAQVARMAPLSSGYQSTDRDGAVRNDNRAAAAPPPPQRGRGRGGATIASMGAMSVPAHTMMHQPLPSYVNDDYDDPNDPFPALTKSHAGGRMAPKNDQTVTVNIRGLGGRGPVQRTALEGADDSFEAVGMPSGNANRPGGRRARGPGETNFVAGNNTITPSLAMAPQFTPTASLSSHFTPTPSLSSMPILSNNMTMSAAPNQQAQAHLQQQFQQQQQQMATEMQQQIYNDMYAQYGMPNQFAAAAQPQYYMMMPGNDGQPQGTYFFAPGSSQQIAGGGGMGGMGGPGGIGPGNQYQYQQPMASQQMGMGAQMGGQMPPLPTGAMPFQPASAANNQGATKPVPRRYTQMSFGNQNQMDGMGH